MASVTVDRNTGLVQIRAYAGRDARTRKVNNLYCSLPAGSTSQEVEEAKRRLEERAKECREKGFSTDVESMFARYFDVCRASGYAPSTVQSYESDFRRHVAPYIGSASVADLRPWTMSEMFMELAASGKVDGTPLGKNSMAKLYSWMNAAFKWMVGEGRVPANPMDGCKRVYPAHVEAEPMSEPDLRKVYAWLAGDCGGWDGLSFRKIVWLALGTGMRRGEIAGLQVADFRMGARDLSVSRALSEAGGLRYKAPKSKASVRRVSVNAGMAADLSAYLAAQRDMLEGAGLSQEAGSPLFCHEDRSPWRPSELTLRFGALRRELGLAEGVHFHSMRHTHASQLLASGCDIRTLQERLGHSSVNTTLRIYGHVLPGRDQAAADAWAGFERTVRGG